MISGQDLESKLGKKGFKEFVVNNRGNQPTKADMEKARRWGRGKTCFQICEHGNVTIRDFEPTGECKACSGTTKVTKSRDFKPYFNIGLGHYVESRSEERRVAKQKGLVEAG